LWFDHRPVNCRKQPILAVDARIDARFGSRPVNGLSPCSCQKMVVASRAIAAFSMMRMIGMLLGRLLLGRSRGIALRRKRLSLVPGNSRLRGINSRSTEKISRLSGEGNFLAMHCLSACTFARIPGFGAESNKFRVIFPVIPVLREFRTAPGQAGSLLIGTRAHKPRPAWRGCSRSQRTPAGRQKGVLISEPWWPAFGFWEGRGRR
jgi:hypothetical protein